MNQTQALAKARKILGPKAELRVYSRRAGQDEKGVVVMVVLQKKSYTDVICTGDNFDEALAALIQKRTVAVVE